MSNPRWRKHFIPLESNPEVFTNLANDLGVSSALSFHDVWTLDELDMLPHPTLALILIFPTSETYENQKAKEEATYDECTGSSDEDVVWFKQTINNACGLYAILHAVCNGDARKFIEPGSLLAAILDKGHSMSPHERALALEESEELEFIYAKAAMSGDTSAPTNAEDDVDYHYICFVKSGAESRLYELDGMRKGPVDKGGVLGPDDDVLSQAGLAVVKEFIQRENGENLGFSLMALTLAT